MDTCFLNETFHRFLWCSNRVKGGDLRAPLYSEHVHIEAHATAMNSTERLLLLMGARLLQCSLAPRRLKTALLILYDFVNC